MNAAPEPRRLCPQCGNTIDVTRMDYGYCDQCRDFHAASADFNRDTYTPPLTMGGGFMRCCSTSLRAWAVYHPGPWAEGTAMKCPFAGTSQSHGMRYCGCGYWHWAMATCAGAGGPASR